MTSIESIATEYLRTSNRLMNMVKNFGMRENFRKCLNIRNGEIFMKLFKERLYHVKTAVMI